MRRLTAAPLMIGGGPPGLRPRCGLDVLAGTISGGALATGRGRRGTWRQAGGLHWALPMGRAKCQGGRDGPGRAAAAGCRAARPGQDSIAPSHAFSLARMGRSRRTRGGPAAYVSQPRALATHPASIVWVRLHPVARAVVARSALGPVVVNGQGGWMPRVGIWWGCSWIKPRAGARGLG